MGTSQDRVALLKFLSRFPEIDPEAIGFAMRIHELVRQADLDFDMYLEKAGLSASRFRVLEALFFEEGRTLTPAELADRVYLTRGAVTTVLDGLEKSGYIRRSQHPTDRRMISVTLTAKGRMLIEKLLPEHFLAMSNIVRDIPRGQSQIVESVFQRVAAGIRKLRDEAK